MRSHRWTLITAPTWEPITLAEAKDHLRVDHTGEDAIIDNLIVAARQYLEGLLGRGIPQQTMTAYYSTFWDLMELPRAAPLRSVSSLKYLDSDGAEQTASTDLYDVFAAPEPGEVRRAYNQSWPSHRVVTDPVYLTYVCGWPSAAQIPAPIRQAMLLLIGHWYENRETTSPISVGDVPCTVPALVAAYRVSWL